MTTLYEGSVPREAKVECYDPDKDEWNQQTEIPTSVIYANSCSMRIFIGFFENKRQREDMRETTTHSAQSTLGSSSSGL